MSDERAAAPNASAARCEPGGLFGALGRLAPARPKLMVALAVALLVAGGAYGGGAFEALDPFGFVDEETESAVAQQQLTAASGVQTGEQVALTVRLPGGADSPAGRQRVSEVAERLGEHEGIAEVVAPGDRGAHPAQLAEDGELALITGRVEAEASIQQISEELPGELAAEDVQVGGSAVAFPKVGEQVEKDLQRAELYAFPLIFALSLLFFRSLVAALLPLLMGAMAIVGSLAGLRAFAELTELSVFAINLVIGLGLGLAIDYSLFIVSRFREELARGAEKAEALRRTLDTAGRTVVFSGITVAAALAALLVFPQRFLFSMGVGGTLISLLSAAAAVTLLPAVLYLLGDRVNAGAPRWLARSRERSALPSEQGAWHRFARAVMRRPIPVATLAAVVLLAAGAPTLGLDLIQTQQAQGVLPDDEEAVAVARQLDGPFAKVPSDPVVLAIEASREQLRGPELRGYVREVEAIEGVRRVTPPRSLDEGTARAEALLAGDDPQSERAQQALEQLRALDAPVPVRTAGPTARLVDERQSILSHVPLAAAIVVVTTLLVLFAMTGSVVIPAKALVMNALTIAASFGLLTLVFQQGSLEGLLDFESRGALDLNNPMLIFAMAFGLSTDYGVFLFTRIKEAYDAGLDNESAVATGLERTGRIVTAAALLFAIALGAFLTSEVIFIKEVGFAVAVAVLIDASIVRALLVPSLMKLLGEWNWWAPRPLRRVHRRLGSLESGSHAQRSPA